MYTSEAQQRYQDKIEYIYHAFDGGNAATFEQKERSVLADLREMGIGIETALKEAEKLNNISNCIHLDA